MANFSTDIQMFTMAPLLPEHVLHTSVCPSVHSVPKKPFVLKLCMMLRSNSMKKDTVEFRIQGEVGINGELGIFGQNK